MISRWQMNDGWNAVFNGNESVVDWGILSFAMNAGKADPHNFEHFDTLEAFATAKWGDYVASAVSVFLREE